MKRLFWTIMFLLLAVVSSKAQFHSAGDDPAGVRWSTISSDNFRIIYPEGNDSLALRYGMELERFRLPLSATSGFTPNERYRRPLPVILHSFTATSNGSVAWAPRRMDLYTTPDASGPEPLPWITELAVHESRHAAQMQFARNRGTGLFNAVVGELFTGAMSGVYPGPALLEGDAVTAETGLTNSGRGRTADFLEHYRVSFAEGDYRNWYRWRWGSQKIYTPDYYRAGYMLIAGMRYVYDDPLFTKRYFDNIPAAWLPLPFFNLQKTVRQASGKNLRKTWKEIAESQQELWAADEAARGPFGPVRPLTPPARRYTAYLSPEAAGNDTYAILQGITTAPKLVRIRPDGSTDVVRPFAAGVSQIRYSAAAGRLFWSEEVPHPRWSLASDSRIFYLEPGSRKVRQLTRGGKLFNPSPDPEGTALAVTEYLQHGGSAVRVLDARDGQTLHFYPAPDSLQVVETAWTDGSAGRRIIASAISPEGAGLYDASDGFHMLMAPGPAKIKQLRSSEEGILFVSDAGGVNELYRLNGDGRAVRLTNHRFGASDFLSDGDSLTFAALTTSGRLLFREAFPSEPVSEGITYSPWPIADRLSFQEKQLTADTKVAEGTFSSPKPYRKFTHLLRLHSWAPIYIDYDAVSTASFESISSSGGLGATAFLQNDLGTASAILGYSASLGVTDNGADWGHAFHGQFTYSGWYPVIELSTVIGGRNARMYSSKTVIAGNTRVLKIEGADSSTPYMRAAARVYVPLDFSRNGWSKGIVPRIDIQFSNDIVNTSEIFHKLIRLIGDKPGIYYISAGASDGHSVPLLRANASVRGYTILSSARSAIYPRWGIGAEGGLSLRPGATDLFSPTAYAYLYGYLPGIMDTHGIKLSAMHQRRMDGRTPDSNVIALPCGMTDISGLHSFAQSSYAAQTRLTADYAFPFLPLDWAGLGPVAYVRNFEMTVHADVDILTGPLAVTSGQQTKTAGPTVIKKTSGPAALLYSAGADLVVRLGNLLWIPYATRVGVSFNLFGSSLAPEYLETKSVTIPGHQFGFILTTDLP